MNHNDAHRREQLCELYIEAIDAENFEMQAQLWELASHDEALVQAFREVHEGLLLEAEAKQDQQVAKLIEQQLPSATPIASPDTVTVAAVMLELSKQAEFLNKPDLAGLIVQLVASDEPIPDALSLAGLKRWMEAKFGFAPPRFWQAFHHARLDLGMRQDASTHYSLAARTAPKDKG